MEDQFKDTDQATAGKNEVTPSTSQSQKVSKPSKRSLVSSHHSVQPPGQIKRSLAESFETPESKRALKQSELVANHEVMFIPLYNRYTIKVKVEKMDQRRKINTARFSGCILECVLSDSSGQVKLTAWSRNTDEQDDVAKMKDQLQKGGTYLVSGALVKPVETTVYNETGHHYELTWASRTKVTPVGII